MYAPNLPPRQGWSWGRAQPPQISSRSYQLTELVIADARASDLKPLEDLTKLTKLHITGLQLGTDTMVSTRPLSSLQALLELSLSGSSSIIDAVPLGKLLALKGLDLTARSLYVRGDAGG